MGCSERRAVRREREVTGSTDGGLVEEETTKGFYSIDWTRLCCVFNALHGGFATGLDLGFINNEPRNKNRKTRFTIKQRGSISVKVKKNIAKVCHVRHLSIVRN